MSEIYQRYQADEQFRNSFIRTRRLLGVNAYGEPAYEIYESGMYVWIRHNRNGTYTLL